METLMYNVLAEMTMLTGKWSLNKFLENTFNSMKKWGHWIILIIGAICLIVAAYKIFVGLKNHGQQPVNWVVNIALLLFGGACIAGGFTMFETIGKGGKETLDELGNTILYIRPLLRL